MSLFIGHVYKSPDVAALAWAIYSRPLMRSGSQYLVVDEHWCDQLFADHKQWLHELDNNPEPLQHFLDDSSSKLIGRRFERLLAFFFTESRFFELVVSNVVLKEQSNTSGEIDFIVLDKRSGELIHFEVACKYYLQWNNSKDPANWPGPNGHDTFQTKMDKLKKQLGVFDTVAGKQFLLEHGLKRPISRAFVKGVFFHHFKSIHAIVSPAGAHPSYNAGWYCSVSELGNFNTNTRQWVVLPKKLWLCPYAFATESQDLLSGPELIDYCDRLKDNFGKSLMIAQVKEEEGMCIEQSRGLIIQNNFRVK
jgi:uncharacterized protein